MEQPDTPPEKIWVVAPAFEEFIYRFWIENEIWSQADDAKPLSPEQQAHLAEARRLMVSA